MTHTSATTSPAPAVITHQPGPGPDMTFARDPGGRPVTWQPGGRAPHLLLTGDHRTGLTTTATVIALEAARQGVQVLACDPAGGGLAALAGWPGIKVAGTPEAAASQIGRVRDEMYGRFTAMETGDLTAADLTPVLLAVDDLDIFAQARSGGGDNAARARTAVRRLHEILCFSRVAQISVLAASHTLPVDVVPMTMLSQFGTQVMLGRPAGPPVPPAMPGPLAAAIAAGVPGVGTVLTGSALTQAHMEWLPRPDATATGSAAASSPLRAMLPPGTAWRGLTAAAASGDE